MLRKPDFLKTPLAGGQKYSDTLNIIKKLDLCTVCTQAACPNKKHCWSKNHAAFLLLGPHCTRNCRFCNIENHPPVPPDPDEPQRIAKAVTQLALKHVVLTSVTRDDLPDGGATHFAKTLERIRLESPETSIEILTPDFRNKPDAPDIIANAKPDVFNHNIETVPRLYPELRPGADYHNSLRLFDKIYEKNGARFLKSGLILGLGETIPETIQTLEDLYRHHVRIITLGQYLQPSPEHYPIKRYLKPQEFNELAEIAKNIGFTAINAAPLVRSSFMAELPPENEIKQTES